MFITLIGKCSCPITINVHVHQWWIFQWSTSSEMEFVEKINFFGRRVLRMFCISFFLALLFATDSTVHESLSNQTWTFALLKAMNSQSSLYKYIKNDLILKSLFFDVVLPLLLLSLLIYY